MVAHVMIHLKPEDLPDKGLRVKYRCGELFDKKLEWGEIAEGLLRAEQSTNDLSEPGININSSGTHGYAGFEHRTGNYWRYLHESVGSPENARLPIKLGILAVRLGRRCMKRQEPDPTF